MMLTTALMLAGSAASFFSILVSAQAELGCSQYDFPGPGPFALEHGVNTVEFIANGQTVSGRARNVSKPYINSGDRDPRRQYEIFGTANGGIQGRSIDFTIVWEGGSIGHYTGTVDDNGFAAGKTVDEAHAMFRGPNGEPILAPTADWHSVTPLVCHKGPPKRIGKAPTR